jgi:ABC-type transport system involved in Fe-S cluster assembly fused permease/ATPase subunit
MQVLKNTECNQMHSMVAHACKHSVSKLIKQRTALLTVVFYVAFTLAITTWRMKYRYEMNDMQSEANTNAVDSLINYETVKRKTHLF